MNFKLGQIIQWETPYYTVVDEQVLAILYVLKDQLSDRTVIITETFRKDENEL